MNHEAISRNNCWSVNRVKVPGSCKYAQGHDTRVTILINSTHGKVVHLLSTTIYSPAPPPGNAFTLGKRKYICRLISNANFVYPKYIGSTKIGIYCGTKIAAGNS